MIVEPQGLVAPIYTVDSMPPVLICKQAADEVINKIKDIVGDNIQDLPNTKGKSTQHGVKGTYDDAVGIFNELGLENVREIKIQGEHAILGKLEDGSTVVVREKSSGKDGLEGLPTLEIQDKTRERTRYTKFRFGL
jgi:hypothetical protein